MTKPDVDAIILIDTICWGFTYPFPFICVLSSLLYKLNERESFFES